MAILLTGGFALAQVPVHAGSALPVPCAGAGVCGKAIFDPLNTKATLGAGVPQLTTGQNGIVINQGTASSAIFNWASFNISQGNTVQFVQPSASAVALNRIFDPNLTTINGNVIANGQIYLVNPNGILFGSHANVNVGGLIASTLDISNSRIVNGLLSDTVLTDPVFSANASVTGSPLIASPGANPEITVQSGATLYAAGRDQSGNIVSAGRVFLFAPTVDNAGTITVDGGGQVILGAGANVYLGSSTDASLRGLLVEVNGGSSAGVSVDATGNITVARGNITLIGLAVNQAGTLTATSALDENGSIRLIARSANPSITSTDPSVLFGASATGPVTLASGSKTEVVLDPTDTSTLPLGDTTASSLQSTIEIEGSSVSIGGQGAPGSTLVQAKGGNIAVTARTASSQNGANIYDVGAQGNLLGLDNAASTITVGSDAVLDVSGLQNVPVNGALYFAYIDRLTSSNLANAPYQRTGFLLGQSLYVNLNDAPSWLDVSNLLSNIAGTQAQRNTSGGTISLNAEGSVNLAKGSVLNVSGGSEAVSASVGRTSTLIEADGTVVNIANASPDTQYIGFADHGGYTAVDSLEGIDTTISWQVPNYTQVPAYTQGANAGTIQIYAPTAQLGGTLLGSTITSPQQRNAPPSGGLLRIGSQNAGALDSEAGISRGSIVLSDEPATAAGLVAGVQSGTPIVLDPAALQASGFTRLDLTSDGIVELAPGSTLNLGAQGQLTIRANAIAIDSSITAPGGNITMLERPITGLADGDTATADELAQRDTVNLITDPAIRGSLVFAPGTFVSTAGIWTNDAYPAPTSFPTTPIVTNGGTISLSGRSLDIAQTGFDVSAGAYQSASGGFTGGNGGTLSLTATYPYAAGGAPGVDEGTMNLGSNFAARIQGYGFGTGGTLDMYAPTLTIGGTPVNTGSSITLSDSVGGRGFQTFGFKSYYGIGTGSGTDFVPTILQAQNNQALDTTPSATNLPAVTDLQAALPGQAFPATITLSATDPLAGTLTIAPGSTVGAGIGGSITLSAVSGIDIAGVLDAPGGAVTAKLASPSQNLTLASVNQRAITLDPTASIDVDGASLVALNASYLHEGNVLNAGTVSLTAPVATIALEPGSVIHARGTSDTVDILQPDGQYTPQVVASSGGTVSLVAGNGILMEGSIAAQGGSATAGGGQLSLIMTTVPLSFIQGSSLPADLLAQLTAPFNINVTSSLPNLAPGTTSFSATADQSYLSPAAIRAAGFSSVWLQSPNSITLGDAGVGAPAQTLSLPASLVLAAPTLALAADANVIVKAPYVALGPAELLATQTYSTGTSLATQATASGGTGTLQVAGGTVDLVGEIATVNAGQVTIDATADVRGIGVAATINGSQRVNGGLNFGGNLTIQSARLYPATQTDFIIDGPTGMPGEGMVLVTDAATQAPTVPLLSAGGSLSFNVESLDVRGRILAPLGAIKVNAAQALTIESGAELSVAGSALVPYGTLENGTAWTYGVPANETNLALGPYTIASSAGVTVAPKGISLSAGTLSAQAGSTINLSSGGDVLGIGFVAGPGGSYDYSQNFPFTSTTSRNPYFAIVPTQGTAIAAFDPQIYSNLVLNTAQPSTSYAGFQMGSTITIAAGSALPAGTYTILPVRYALLPGAFAVEAAAGYANLQPGSVVSMPDGTAIVAGRLGDAAAGTIAPLWQGFRVYTNAQFNTLSEFQLATGSTFFDATASEFQLPTPRVGTDAGTLQVAAAAAALDGAIEATHAAASQGADIAIDVPSIVVANGTTPAAPSATLTLSATALSQLEAQSLVLGALDARSPTTAASGASTGVVVTLNDPVASTSVAVTASNPLSAGEIILSSASVSVADQAQLHAATAVAAATTSLTTQGDGALLYLGSGTTLPTYARTGASAAGTATTGNLSVGAATLTGGSLVLDATDAQIYAPTAALRAQSIDLSASVVNLGSPPAGTTGVNLNSGLLATLGGASELVFTTLGGVDVYGSATLGQLSAAGHPLLASLDLVGPGIFGFGDASSVVTINAGHLTVQNPAGSAPSQSGTGAGQLTIATDASAGGSADGSIDIAGAITIGGFQSASLSATGTAAASASSIPQTVQGAGDLLFSGAAGSNSSLTIVGAGANLTVAATRITAQSGVDAAITVPGSFVLGSSGPAAAAQTQQLGASLLVAASDITLGGVIDLPAGAVSLQSTGTTAAQGISLNAGASIRVAGVTQSFGSTTQDVGAGSITLVSASGSISQATGATLDVSATGTSGNAGTLSLLAPNGTVSLGGTLVLTPGANGSGAQVNVDASSLANADAIVGAITSGAGAIPLGAVSLRARNGNIAIDAGTGGTAPLAAQSITLEADGGQGATDGSIQVAGTLNAGGSSGGQIALYANNQIVLEPGAVLDVHASGTGQAAGSVLLSARVNANPAAPTSLDAVVLQPGATVNLAGGSGGTDGTITLQANAAPNGNDVQIAPIPQGVIQGTNASTIVEPVVVDAYTGPLTVDAGLMASEAAKLASLMSATNEAAMAQRLGFALTDANFALRPGLEITSTGTMMVTDPIDFSTGLQSVATGAGNFTWRYGGSTLATSQPGVLILRAGGDLDIQAGINDGFLNYTDNNGNPAATVWKSGSSWSYVLTGGADLSAINANRTVAGAGSVNVGNESEPGVVVRTGTGSIALNAGQDVVLNNGAGQQDNVVYTAGVNSVIAPSIPQYAINDPYGNFTYVTPVFTQGGGNLSISAQGNVQGAAADGSNPDGSTQSVNEWLFRVGLGTASSPTAWWTDFASFQQGFGVLGGGNLSIAAGADLIRVGAVVAASGYAVNGSVTQFNSGALVVNAGGNISQGLFYDEAGAASLRAASLTYSAAADPGEQYVRFAQGSGTLSIEVRDGAQFALPFNPTVSSPSLNLDAYSPASTFFTYGPGSILNLQAAAGDVSLQQGGATSNGNLDTNFWSLNFGIVPTNVQITAFGGSIVGPGFTAQIDQYPDANGQLRLLAGGGISQLDWLMSQSGVSVLPTAAGTPTLTTAFNLATPADQTTPLHAADTALAEVVARNGSIASVQLNIPKTTEISAGNDIGPLAAITIQNSNAGSLSRIAAGNQLLLNSSTPFDYINIAGVGAAEVDSGGAMNLGTDGGGIVSVGNLTNVRLPAQGATLIVSAGNGTVTTAGGVTAVSPDYLNVIDNFVRYDAFAASGSDAASLDGQVLSTLGADASMAPLVSILQSALANRSAATRMNSSFSLALAQLSPAQIAVGAVKLASAIQVVANGQFVASSNKETFAPGYVAFTDLYPNLAPAASVIRSFVLDDPFAVAPDAATLRTQALQGLPSDLVAAINLGIASPGSVNQAGSAFSNALGAIDPATLSADARQLLANVLAVAGQSREQLAASGQLTGTGSPYATALTALAAAFTPQTEAGLNDIQMQYSEIKTEQTGSVAVLAPQGGILVGQSSPPVLDPIAAAKTAAQLGIFTVGGGDIIGMARDNFNVFESRVFTIAGGNISLWSSQGNIDAGRGPRDVAVASPPQLAIDPNTGVEYLDFSASVTGSGIGALVTQADQPPSNINLMAPAGYVDAGEAGIRAQNGSVVLGTNLVLNASNIQAASGVSGGAVVATPPPPAPPAANTSQGDRVAEDAQRNALAQQLGAEERGAGTLRVVVSGEFLGFEKCSSGDSKNNPDCEDVDDSRSP